MSILFLRIVVHLFLLHNRTANFFRRKRQKLWHGPSWNKLARALWGIKTRRVQYGSGSIVIRPCQINDVLALFGRREEAIVENTLHALRPGDTFVDIGAYIGQHTLLAAKLLGKDAPIVSIEPNLQNLAILRQNLELNDATHIRVMDCAVGSQEGVSELVYLDSDQAVTSLDSNWCKRLYGTSVPARTVQVKVHTLQSLLLEAGISRVDLLKIDVEGAEGQILSPARDFLASGRIRRIVCEIHSPDDDLVPLLNSCGFDASSHEQHIYAIYREAKDV